MRFCSTCCQDLSLLPPGLVESAGCTAVVAVLAVGWETVGPVLSKMLGVPPRCFARGGLFCMRDDVFSELPVSLLAAVSPE